MSLFRCIGQDVREVRILRNEAGGFTLVLCVYVLETHRQVTLSGVRELPDMDELFEANRVVISEDVSSQLEFGSYHIEFWTEAYNSFWSDSFTNHEWLRSDAAQQENSGKPD